MLKFDRKIVQFGFGAVGKSFYEKVSKEIKFDEKNYYVISRDDSEFAAFINMDGMTENFIVQDINKDNFKEEVMNSNTPVLLDFWAPWCGPCQMVLPIVEEIANERSDIKVGKVNVDEQKDLAKQFRVLSIPTLVVIKDGKIEKRSMGAKSKDQILEML